MHPDDSPADRDEATDPSGATPGLEPHACAVCGRALDYVVGFGWRHPARDFEGPADHLAVPTPYDTISLRGRCDLCGADQVTATLHTGTITIAGQHADGTTEAIAGFDDAWACCAVCARLIRKDRWDALLERCVRAVAASAAGGRLDDQLVSQLRDLHTQLRATATGKPEPL